jgi:hypothetical protein
MNRSRYEHKSKIEEVIIDSSDNESSMLPT